MLTSRVILGGRYELDTRIGAGGFSEVWRASDQTLGRPVAVKLLYPGFAQHDETLIRFRAEARHAGRLSHENIARVYDYGEPTQDLPPYLVMELVDGPSLAEVLTGGPLNPIRTARILGQAAAGLAAAHEAGLIHRDIKPGNLLIGPRGVVKITDFGISHAADSAPLTGTGLVVGTPGYLAPERATGSPATPAGDLYALGIVAYECLAGAAPFTGTPLEVTRAHCSEPLPELPPSVPPDLVGLILGLTARRPGDRPASAAAVAVRATQVADRMAAGPAGAALQAADLLAAGAAEPGATTIAPGGSALPGGSAATAGLPGSGGLPSHGDPGGTGGSGGLCGPAGADGAGRWSPGGLAGADGASGLRYPAGPGDAGGRGDQATARLTHLPIPESGRHARPLRPGLNRGRLAAGAAAAAVAVIGAIVAASQLGGPAAQPGGPASSRPPVTSQTLIAVSARSLIGQPVGVVARELRRRGLTVRVRWEHSAAEPPRTVLAVLPAGRLPAGSLVVVTGALPPPGHADDQGPGKGHKKGKGHGKGHG